mmetsp:Transcript_24814/g.69513  ORF Transcript_24814/g.69513 Transcript_24814/m.69513 type:complete len:480 (+) Transcript_24814:86-1525(+)|eukprot:CAMPEP_0119125574 /NCGR_PEP_ID=MMETSP1310-20130426/4798_1 /TAXON_ID=464262 /ORGANISM="Genus nov. species nov., Strain RCC2339" /LENGTH=479 /DNA_ID=CAMNT_0007115655 /DNA_START=165 /DNA_END=1604 /DNA_ORIENTATION=+
MDTSTEPHDPIGIEVFMLASWRGISTIFLIAGTGSLLRIKGIVTAESKNAITGILMKICIPSLAFLSTASRISAEMLLNLWVIPVIALVHIIIGISAGYIGSLPLGLPKPVRALVMVTTAFPNSISLPLAMLVTLDASIGDRSDWLDLDKGTSIVLAYAAVMILARWTIGFYTLKPKEDWGRLAVLETDSQDAIDRAAVGDVEMVLLTKDEDLEQTEESNEGDFGVMVEATDYHDDGSEIEGTFVGDKDIAEVDEPPSEEENDPQETEELTTELPTPGNGGAESYFTKFFTICSKIPPPVTGIILGIVIGLSPAQKYFFPDVDSDGVHEEEGFTLAESVFSFFGTLIVSALDPLSTITVPLSLLLLGYSLVGISAWKKIGVKGILLSMFLKLFFMPAAACAIFYIGSELGVFNGIPITTSLAVLLPTAMPPATAIIVLTNVHKCLSEEVATLIFFNFLGCFFTLPIITVLFTFVIRSML